MHRMRATTKRKPPAAIPGTRCTGRRRSGLKRRVRERSGAPVGRSVHSVHDEPRGPPATPLRCAPSARRRCAWCPRHARPGRRTGDDRAKRWYIESMSERYDPSTIEPNWQRYWDEHETFRAERHRGTARSVRARHVPVPVGRRACTSATPRATPRPTSSRATSACAASTCCTRWAGTRSACPPSSTRSRPARTRARPRARNIATFRRQLKMLGFSLRLGARGRHHRSRATCSWTQWIFLQLFERGLAYQAEVPVNWCPALGTVLANEEVVDGKSERGEHPVERVPLRQWMLRITAYADRLPRISTARLARARKIKQRNWIGRSEGAEVDFAVEGHADEAIRGLHDAPRHAVRRDLRRARARAPAGDDDRRRRAAARPSSTLRRRRPSARATSIAPTLTKTKTGVATGALRDQPGQRRQDPRSGSPTTCSAATAPGAIMAVPGARRARLRVRQGRTTCRSSQVVAPANARELDVQTEAFTDDGVAVARAREGRPIADGTPSDEVRKAITAWLEKRRAGRCACHLQAPRLGLLAPALLGRADPDLLPGRVRRRPAREGRGVRRFATISRSRSTSRSCRCCCPSSTTSSPGDDPAGPLARALDWRFFQKDGQWFARETNTMPQWAGSCWYYLRFTRSAERPRPRSSPEADDAWMPVDLYVGGAEHAVLHLLYARFWHKVLFDLGLVKHDEPFIKLVHQGMILGEDNQKMSQVARQRRQPRRRRAEHGADALRLYEMFMGPLEAGEALAERAASRACAASSSARGTSSPRARCRSRTIRAPTTSRPSASFTRRCKKVTQDIEALRFNTAIERHDDPHQPPRRTEGRPARGRAHVRAPALAVRAAPRRGAVAAPSARRRRSPTSRGPRSTRRSSRTTSSRSACR